MAVGSGKADEKGNVVKSSLSVGDTVLYSKYSGVEFEVQLLMPSSMKHANKPLKCREIRIEWAFQKATNHSQQLTSLFAAGQE